MRTPIWVAPAFALLAGGALAAPSVEAPIRAPQSERPTFSEAWKPSEGWALGEFVLPYEAVRTADDPDAALRAFLQTTFDAAAKAAEWDLEPVTQRHFPS